MHGSFPSERPLIITEEDYRTYPKKFAPFVNTVQQSLLENTLCLIGFSGEDPNFLQWIGWISDNIGKENSPKIYLVGVLNLTDAQKKLISSKNIVPLDLSSCHGVNGDHKKGLDLFLTYLSEAKRKKSSLDWPLATDLKTMHFTSGMNVKDLIQEWNALRIKYPNWVILPQEQRATLWLYTEDFSSNEELLSELPAFDDLDYIYELNWRLERCLFPIWNNMVLHFKRILDRYNPFPSGIHIIRELNYDVSSDVNWSDIQNKWITLSLSLLRFYREEDFVQEWENLELDLSRLMPYFTPEHLAQLYYEKVLMSIFKLNNDEAKSILNQWPINGSMPFWEVKRASLIAELGNMEDAERIIEDSLVTIRKRLNLSPIENNYNWVSQEAYVMFLLRLIKSNIHFLKRDFKEYDNLSFNERWSNLLQYKCDPWGESKYFDMTLQQQLVPKATTSIEDDFEIGKSTRTTHIRGGIDQGLFEAYTFLRYLEEIGIPMSLSHLNLNTKTINGALKRIIFFSPNWVFAVMNRHRDYKSVGYTLGREYLRRVEYTQVDKYIDHYLERFDQLLTMRGLNSLADAVIDKIPGIFSRLCVKCSSESKMKMFTLYQKIYKLGIRLSDLDKLLENLIESSSNEILSEAIPLLLSIPVLREEDILMPAFVEPFDLLNHVKFIKPIKIGKEILEDLFRNAKSTDGFRRRALKRLMFLYSNKLLNKQHQNKLFRTIWSQRNNIDGFPEGTNFYYFAFCKWPQPTEINASKLYREYFFANTFKIHSKYNGEKKGISMSREDDRYAIELLNGSYSVNNEKGIKWTESELVAILSKCEAWWNADKHFLVNEEYKDIGLGRSICEQFQLYFNNLANVIAVVFGRQQSAIKDKNILERIRVLILDIERHDVPILRAKAAFRSIVYNSPDEYLLEFQKALSSKKRNHIFDALESFKLVLKNSFNSNEEHLVTTLLDIIFIPLKWRIESLMADIFNFLKGLLDGSQVDYTQVEEVLIEAIQYLRLEREKRENFDSQFLLLNQRAIAIAGCLYRKMICHNRVQIPEEITKWKQISEEVNEFGDIANHW